MGNSICQGTCFCESDQHKHKDCVFESEDGEVPHSHQLESISNGLLLVVDETITTKLIRMESKLFRDLNLLASICNTKSFTYCFWMKIIKRTKGEWCSLLHRGGGNSTRRPELLLHPTENRLHVRADTNLSSNVGISCSHFRLKLEELTHIAISFDSSGTGEIRLYVNGTLDLESMRNVFTCPQEHFLPPGSEPCYIGKSPWHSATKIHCKDLRVFDRALYGKDVNRVMCAAPSILDIHLDAIATNQDNPESNEGVRPHGLELIYDELVENKCIDNETNMLLHNDLTEMSCATSYSYCMWIKVLKPSSNNWCTLLHRGGSHYVRRPGLWLSPSSNRLHVRADSSFRDNIGIDESRAELTCETWVHIAIVFNSAAAGSVELHVNGLLDSASAYCLFSKHEDHFLPAYSEPLYVGYCASRVHVKDLRAFSCALSTEQIVEVMREYNPGGVELPEIVEIDQEAAQRSLCAKFGFPPIHLELMKEYYRSKEHLCLAAKYFADTTWAKQLDYWYGVEQAHRAQECTGSWLMWIKAFAASCTDASHQRYLRVLPGETFLFEVVYTHQNCSSASICQLQAAIDIKKPVCNISEICVQPERNQSKKLALTAPEEPGLYMLWTRGDCQYSLADAEKNYPSDYENCHDWYKTFIAWVRVVPDCEPRPPGEMVFIDGSRAPLLSR